jgi:hypothetical protein
MDRQGSDNQCPETFLECAFGAVRIQGETALVFVGGTLEVWRGPFTWSVGELIEVEGPRGREIIVSPGDVVSSVRLRSRRG